MVSTSIPSEVYETIMEMDKYEMFEEWNGYDFIAMDKKYEDALRVE